MIDALPLLLGPEGYQISRSVRLRSSANAYFNRTPGTQTNRKTWTWSGWTKVSKFGVASNPLFSAIVSGAYVTEITFNAANQLDFLSQNSSGTVIGRKTSTAVYRDPSAWYHIVVAIDTSDATASNRIKIYVNGIQITSFAASTDFALNDNTGVNDTTVQRVGARASGTYFFDGYLTEINFIDGQALTPSSFGEYDTITGVWKPKKYAGTYGTNGFYLNFSDNSAATAAAIGKDSSGNGNNWTPNNISVTAGVTYDSMLDVPTPWADGGNGRGNYAVINPINKPSTATIYNANLYVDHSASGGEQPATIAVNSGKWYWESICGNQFVALGIIPITSTPSASSFASGYHYYGSNGNFYTGVSAAAYGATLATNDVVGVALDLDTNQITFYKNGVSQGAKSIAANTYFPDFAAAAATTNAVNFGQRPFSYTPPTGFRALNTQNLPDATIPNGRRQFDVSLYTGTGSAQSITNYGFQPDLVWVKNRSVTSNNRLVDVIRGVSSVLSSNVTDAESTDSAGITSFNSGGFSVGTSSGFNNSPNSYVGWQWKAGGAAVTNTAGSISSQVSANPTAGFSVVTYTTPSSFTNATVGHGLGVAPRLIIVKARSATSDWITHHASLGTNGYVTLNTTSASGSNSGSFNGTSSTTFTLGSNAWWQAAPRDWVAYCFSEVAGYSKFGSYTGNGSADGPFIFLGFRPRYFLIKRTDLAYDWYIHDTARDTYNTMNKELYPNTADAEVASSRVFDALSNGFKVRDTNAGINANGGTYIFAAFAENPFKNSLAR